MHLLIFLDIYIGSYVEFFQLQNVDPCMLVKSLSEDKSPKPYPAETRKLPCILVNTCVADDKYCIFVICDLCENQFSFYIYLQLRNMDRVFVNCAWCS